MTDKLDLGIGTKETAQLEPMPVKVIFVSVEMQKDKTGKEIGEKVALACKHPAKTENIEISQLKYEKDSKVKTSGIWFKLDEDGLIPKQSALATMLKFYGVTNVRSLIGKELQTSKDEQGYLCIKAY